MNVNAYLFFEGRCAEALDFYRQSLGAEIIESIPYKDHPGPEQQIHGDPEKIMHCSFRIGNTMIWASDGRCAGAPTFQGFSLALYVATEAEAEKYFAALSDGGSVATPIAPTFFTSRFGMVTDRFGVLWMVLVGR